MKGVQEAKQGVFVQPAPCCFVGLALSAAFTPLPLARQSAQKHPRACSPGIVFYAASA